METLTATGEGVRNPALATAYYFQVFLLVFEIHDTSRNASEFIDSVAQSSNRIKEKALYIQIEGARIARLIPEDVIRAFVERIERCWERYTNILQDDGSYLPSEIDEATDAVIKCICRELQRLFRLNQGIPGGILTDYWEKYACSTQR